MPAPECHSSGNFYVEPAESKIETNELGMGLLRSLPQCTFGLSDEQL
jgi:hypothetical protein